MSVLLFFLQSVKFICQTLYLSNCNSDFNDFDQCFDEYWQQLKKEWSWNSDKITNRAYKRYLCTYVHDLIEQMAAGHTFSKVALEKMKRIVKHVNEMVKPAFQYSFQGLLDSHAYRLADLIDLSKSITSLVKM